MQKCKKQQLLEKWWKQFGQAPLLKSSCCQEIPQLAMNAFSTSVFKKELQFLVLNDFHLMGWWLWWCWQKWHSIYVSGCTDATCGGHTASRFSMPLTSLGAKKYYLGIFFKVPNNLITWKYKIRKETNSCKIKMFLQANWYKAEQYCRFHGMHLAR